MIVSIQKIKETALHRKPGYEEAWLKLGKVTGEGNSMLVEITTEQWHQIRRGFRLGLGDLVSKMATPIARALKMDCIDQSTNNLKPESPCAKRRDALNKIRI